MCSLKYYMNLVAYLFTSLLCFLSSSWSTLLLQSSIQLREFILLSELVEDLLKRGILGLVFIDGEFISIHFHIFNEPKQVTNAFFSWFVNLNCHLVACELCQSSLAELFLEMCDNSRDLIQNNDSLEKLLQIDWLPFLDLMVLHWEHAWWGEFLVELERNKIRTITCEVIIFSWIRHFTLKPLSNSFPHFVQSHVVIIWISQLIFFIN